MIKLAAELPYLQLKPHVQWKRLNSVSLNPAVTHSADPACSRAARYFAALNQAWLCQSRPIRVTIAPAVITEYARWMSVLLTSMTVG